MLAFIGKDPEYQNIDYKKFKILEKWSVNLIKDTRCQNSYRPTLLLLSLIRLWVWGKQKLIIMRNYLLIINFLIASTLVSYGQEYFKVETEQGWQNTEFSVTANKPLAIAVIGYLNNNSDANNRRFNYYGPSGSVGDRADYNPMPNAPSGSLIAKIGENGEPFGIGDFKIFADGGQNPINESGDLYLRINDADNNLPDNDGTFFVWIMQLDNSTSVNSISASNQIHIYPNPTKTNLTVEIKNHGLNNCTIELYDNKGQIVSKNENCIVGKTLIDISKFKSGIYITKIVDEKGNIVASEKIMKE